MATAFLLPQDCLPTSKSRHNARFSDALYGCDITPGARDTLQASYALCGDQSRHRINLNRRGVWTATLGSTIQPEQGRISTPVQKDVDGKKTKARRPAELRATMPNVPVFMILRRPKDTEVANDVIEKLFIKEDEAESTTGLRDSKIEGKPIESNVCTGAKNPFVEVKNGVPNFRMGVVDRAVEGPKVQGSKSDLPKLQSSSTKVDWLLSKDLKTERGKHRNVNLSPSKPTSVAKRSSHIRFDELVSTKGLNQMLSPKAIGEQKSLRTAGAVENLSGKLADAKQPAMVDNTEEGVLARLKRASTDPQIVKHLVTHYRSNVMEIPRSDTQSFLGIMRSSSMSCPERWAGPAYSSSPAPSSLPLPKFSRPNQKMPSRDCSPLLEGIKRNSPQLPKSAPVRGLPAVPLGGDLDVASATRSLRRMLKLEPM